MRRVRRATRRAVAVARSRKPETTGRERESSCGDGCHLAPLHPANASCMRQRQRVGCTQYLVQNSDGMRNQLISGAIVVVVCLGPESRHVEHRRSSSGAFPDGRRARFSVRSAGPCLLPAHWVPTRLRTASRRRAGGLAGIEPQTNAAGPAGTSRAWTGPTRRPGGALRLCRSRGLILASTGRPTLAVVNAARRHACGLGVWPCGRPGLAVGGGRSPCRGGFRGAGECSGVRCGN